MIQFGPSGNCEKFYGSGFAHTEQSASFVKANGLDCFEYSFGRGVRAFTEEKAKKIRSAFAENGVEISVHAPYFINFANPDDEMAEKSYGYVLDSALVGKSIGAKRVVFHPATQGKMTREDAVEKTKDRLKILRDLIYEAGHTDCIFSPETMGKHAQIGTVEEIVDFCKIDDIFVPCIDFGHVNAREGGSLKTVEDYLARLSYAIDGLGYEKMKHFHIHFSKIMYGAKGEIKHLTFADETYGPSFEPLAEALYRLRLEPYVICESAGTQTDDAVAMKRAYFALER